MQHHKRLSKISLAWLLLLPLFGGFILAAQTKVNESNELTEQALSVITRTIEKQSNYHVAQYFSALVQPQSSIQLSSELSGKIDRILVDDGARVEAGQLLFVLDTQLLDSQQDLLLARRKSLQADLALTEKRLMRQQNLKQESFSAEDSIDALEAEKLKLLAGLQGIRAQLKDVAIKLEKSEVKAPFSGAIQQRFLDQGAVVQSGTPVLELISVQQAEVVVGLPLNLVNQLLKEQDYDFLKSDHVNSVNYAPSDQSINSKEKYLIGNILAVLPEVELITQTQGVKFSIDQSSLDKELTPGDLLKLRLSTERQAHGFWIPNTALIEGQKGLWEIFIVADNNRVKKQTVSIIYAGNPESYVNSSVPANSRIVINGVHRLANNVLVNSLDETDIQQQEVQREASL